MGKVWVKYGYTMGRVFENHVSLVISLKLGYLFQSIRRKEGLIAIAVNEAIVTQGIERFFETELGIVYCKVIAKHGNHPHTPCMTINLYEGEQNIAT